MKQKQTLLTAALVLLLSACSTTKTVTPAPEPPAAEETAPVVSLPIVAPNTEFVSIGEAITLLSHPEEASVLAKKYGYKSVSPYAVYRLDVYKEMLYKNCRPAKTVGSSMYEDTPKPLRKGTSSYVAIKEDITIGVFNAVAYGNLVQQLSAAGFTLVSDGHEQEYSNGTITAYCYEARKTVRLEKN